MMDGSKDRFPGRTKLEHLAAQLGVLPDRELFLSQDAYEETLMERIRFELARQQCDVSAANEPPRQAPPVPRPPEGATETPPRP